MTLEHITDRTDGRRVRLKEIQEVVKPGALIPVSVRAAEKREDFHLTVVSCTPHGFRVAKNAEEPEHWAYYISWKCAYRGRMGLFIFRWAEVVGKGEREVEKMVVV